MAGRAIIVTMWECHSVKRYDGSTPRGYDKLTYRWHIQAMNGRELTPDSKPVTSREICIHRMALALRLTDAEVREGLKDSNRFKIEIVTVIEFMANRKQRTKGHCLYTITPLPSVKGKKG